MKAERVLVKAIAKALKREGFKVATEVANFYRSADIAAVDAKGRVWIIECKISNIEQALEQTRIHKLSADMVFIGTPRRNMRSKTTERIIAAGVGLIYVAPDGSIVKAANNKTKARPWRPAKERLRRRILESE